jgi:hypothetical protein
MEKDQAVVAVREFFKEHDIVSYVFIDEAWVVQVTDRADLKVAPRNHPDRREVVFLVAEDEHGELHGERDIVREQGRPPTLGPLKVIKSPHSEHSEGRMTGMLPQKGRAQ